MIAVRIAGERALRRRRGRRALRDALGVVLPPGLPEAFLEPVEDPLRDLLSRYARTHGPFRLEDAAARFGLAVGIVRLALDRLAERGRVLEGEFLPGGSAREWCDAEVLRAIKRRSLAKLRREVEPVEPAAFARFLAEWQGVARPRAGLEALLAAVEQLQGAPIPASVLEAEVLPARVERLSPGRPRRAPRRRRDRLAGPRAARPVGRPRRALPGGPRAAARAAPGRRRRASSRRRVRELLARAARSSSPTSRPRRAPSRASSSRRSGTSSGPARSPTTRSRRCARCCAARRRRPPAACVAGLPLASAGAAGQRRALVARARVGARTAPTETERRDRARPRAARAARRR